MIRVGPFLVAIVLSTSSVAAQSSGETALFLLTGRDGLEFGPTGVAVVEDRVSPCPEDAQRTCRVTTTISRLAPCRYETTVTVPELTTALILDFGQVARIGFERSTAGAPYVDTAAFTGARGVMCLKGAAPWTCMERDTVTPDRATPVDRQRFTDAFAYMRRTFCPGRAY